MLLLLVEAAEIFETKIISVCSLLSRRLAELSLWDKKQNGAGLAMNGWMVERLSGEGKEKET